MNKELKKLKRKELLELLLEQTKRIEELENEIDNLNKKLESKKVIFKNAGSLADAALQLSGIFSVAQETADIYLSNIKDLKEKMVNFKLLGFKSFKEYKNNLKQELSLKPKNKNIMEK